MAKLKRRADGRYKKTFTFEGKPYCEYGKTVREAEQKMAERLALLAQGVEKHKNPTLNVYYERFTEIRRKSVRESTIRCQACQFRNCADTVVNDNGKTLGEMRIRDIKKRDIQNVQLALAQTDRTTETVNNCLSHLLHVFNSAVDDETIDKNPCKGVKPLQRVEKPARETIHRALTLEETRLFFEEASNSYYYPLFCLMIQTGMRIGECGGLFYSDIDEKEGFIHVRRTVTRNEDGGYEIGNGAKTFSGIRDIPLNESIRKALNKQRLQNAQFYGKKLYSTLFRSPEGEILREYPVNREIKRICKRVGIEKFTCHAFRATFSTRFIETQPENYKTLSEILGHKDTRITLNLYTHVMQESKVTAMEKMQISV